VEERNVGLEAHLLSSRPEVAIHNGLKAQSGECNVASCGAAAGGEAKKP
jgi:hypothetical protein